MNTCRHPWRDKALWIIVPLLVIAAAFLLAGCGPTQEAIDAAFAVCESRNWSSLAVDPDWMAAHICYGELNGWGDEAFIEEYGS